MLDLCLCRPIYVLSDPNSSGFPEISRVINVNDKTHIIHPNANNDCFRSKRKWAKKKICKLANDKAKLEGIVVAISRVSWFFHTLLSTKRCKYPKTLENAIDDHMRCITYSRTLSYSKRTACVALITIAYAENDNNSFRLFTYVRLWKSISWEFWAIQIWRVRALLT